MGNFSNLLKKSTSILVILIFVVSLVGPISLAYNNNGSYYYGPSLNGTYMGNLPSNYIISFSIFIPPNNLSYLSLISQEVANKQIKPLSKSQVLNIFAPSSQEFNNLIKYLESQGFIITYESPDRFSVMVQGTVAQVEKVFDMKLGLYKNNGIIYYAPESSPKIPSQLSNYLIFGLNNYTSFTHPYIELGKIVDHNLITNNSALTNVLATKKVKMQEAGGALYYTPGDFEGAYNVTNIMQYSNKTSIAIIDAYGDPLIQQDISEFDSMFGLPQANLTIIPIGPYHPSLGILTGWDVETALDVEAAQTMAPYAHIYLVVASNSANALYEAIDYIVSEDLANVVSMSWGASENLLALTGFYTSNPEFEGLQQNLGYTYADYYFALGTAEGISFFASSGDQGAYGGTMELYGGVIYPSTSPFVTAVGGTSLFVNVTSGYLSYLNSTGTYGYENAWSVSPLYGTSEVASTGGYSTLIPKPWYQVNVTSGNFRSVPDVAADANPYTGFVEIVDGSLTVIGGTSLASPLWAGVAADLDGYLNTSLGLLNPILYKIYSNKTLYNMAFHQINFGYNGYYYAHNGYNEVTGLGSPNAGLLAIAIKDIMSSEKELSVSVSTFEPGSMYPWYMYNTTFTIMSMITYPNGSLVTSGNVNASIYTINGLIESIPLSFNGQYWVGNVFINQSMPPNLWNIVVNAKSGNYSGLGATDVDVGVGLAIIEPPTPFPYPYGFPIPVNYPFPIEVYATLPNGEPASNLTLTAYLIKNGVVYQTIPLISQGDGSYVGYGFLPYPDPQGSYILLVNSTEGSVYTYEYFGEAILLGYVITPVNDGLPSASPGETVTLAAEVMDPFGFGLYTSNVEANIYNSSNYLIAQVPLSPTSSGLQVGSYTIPENLTPGFYNVVFVSNESTANGPLYGYLNQSFYVSSSSLMSQINSVSLAYEGQNIKIMANITYPNGTEVKYGMFTATLIPDSEVSNLLSLSFTVGIPLQYNSTLNEWIGVEQLPSLSNQMIYTGYNQNMLSGPWSITVSGESADGNDIISSPFNIYVMPYTYLGSMVLTLSNISSLPLGTVFGNTLYGIYSSNLTIINATLDIENSNVQQLNLINSTVTIEGSNINSLIANKSSVVMINDNIGPSMVGISLYNSTLKLIDSNLENLIYGFSQVNSQVYLNGVDEYNVSQISKISKPELISITPSNITSNINNITIEVSGYLKVFNVELDGVPVTYSYEHYSNMTVINAQFDSSLLPDGFYSVEVLVNNGLNYTLMGTIYNSYHLVIQDQSLSSNVNKVLSALRSNISNVESTLSSYIVGNTSAINNTLNSKISEVSSTFSSQISAISSQITSVKSTIASQSNISSNIASQISSLSSMLSTFNSSVKSAYNKASGSYTMSTIGLVFGLLGIIVGLIALSLSRRGAK